MPQCPPSKYQAAAVLLGGQAPDPAQYDHTIEGFDQFLSDSGAVYFSGQELSRPRHPSIAKELGFDSFLPPQSLWPRSAACALVADRCRLAAKGPVMAYNHWRPLPYNMRVTGSNNPLSDHPNGCAIDLHFRSVHAREQAEARLWPLYRGGLLKLSLGLGLYNLHVGVLSPIGQRHWYYADYPR